MPNVGLRDALPNLHLTAAICLGDDMSQQIPPIYLLR